MNWGVLTELSPPEIQIHWVTVTIAFFLGLIIFSQKKGTAFHKAVGWTYVFMMAVTVVAAFFIRSTTGGDFIPVLNGFSPIHLFIPLTVFGIGGALVAIKRGNVRQHSRRMIGVFIGGILIAGLFTFIPGRRMHLFFFGDKDAIAAHIDSEQAQE